MKRMMILKFISVMLVTVLSFAACSKDHDNDFDVVVEVSGTMTIGGNSNAYQESVYKGVKYNVWAYKSEVFYMEDVVFYKVNHLDITVNDMDKVDTIIAESRGDIYAPDYKVYDPERGSYSLSQIIDFFESDDELKGYVLLPFVTQVTNAMYHGTNIRPDQSTLMCSIKIEDKYIIHYDNYSARVTSVERI